MTAITKTEQSFFIRRKKNYKKIKKEIKNMILGGQLLFFCHLPKYHFTFLCWFVFLVFNTLQQKTRNNISFSPQK